MLGPGDKEILRARLHNKVRRELHRPDLPRAAVLAVIMEQQGGWSLLFSKRSERVATHRGQVAFPGGHVEKEDADIVATALREAEEEVGLDPKQLEVLGLLDDVISITDVWVTPILALLHGDFSPRLQKSEVDSVFSLSFAQLRDERDTSANLIRETELGTISFPVFRGGPAPVWGLTAWMVDELLPLLYKEPAQ